MSLSLRAQLTILVPGAVALGIMSLAYFGAEEERRDELNDERVRGVELLESFGVSVALYVAQNDHAGLDTLVAHLYDVSRGSELLELMVVDDDARVVAHSDPEQFNTVLNDEFLNEAIRSDSPIWKIEGDALRVAAPARSALRWATVAARYSLKEAEAAAERMRRLWTGIAFIVFIAMGLVLYVGLERMVTRPIRTLQQSVRRIGEGALHSRVPPLRARELADLSEMVNRMAASLEAERANLERTVADRTRELSDANSKLQQLSVTDGLTGVFNHRRFHEALQTEFLRAGRTNRPVSVVMVDVDFFKKVNDALGHPAGDTLLREIAAALGQGLRATDMLARYGGEEFALLLPETSKTEAIQVGERVRAAVEERCNRESTKWPQRISVSVGVATFPEDGATADATLHAADQALYAAKRTGRNRVVAARSAPA